MIQAAIMFPSKYNLENKLVFTGQGSHNHDFLLC